MKLKDYMKGLNDFLIEHPESAEFTVVTSSDDEGNSYNEVYFSPSIGQYEDREFQTEEYDPEEEITLNAICVN